MPRPSVATTTAAKPALRAELTERVTQILNALLDPADAVQLVDVLTREGRVAESAPRGDVRLVWRHALAAVALGQSIEVGVDLQPRLLVQTAAVEHEEEPRDPRAKPGPHLARCPSLVPVFVSPLAIEHEVPRHLCGVHR